jgi:hypothetical protein
MAVGPEAAAGCPVAAARRSAGDIWFDRACIGDVPREGDSVAGGVITWLLAGGLGTLYGIFIGWLAFG